MAISVTRLSGGTTPADGSDPRTFPTIWNGTADSLEALDTDDVAEGANLYYTDARVDAVIAASDTDDLSEGATNLYYTNARVEAIAAPLLFVENGQTENYTLALSDSAKVVAMNNASARTVTIPANATVAFPVGSVVNVYRQGAGAVTVAAAAGVTLRNGGAISSQFGEVSCRKRATNEWVLAGDAS
jgi:hypothetical protein